MASTNDIFINKERGFYIMSPEEITNRLEGSKMKIYFELVRIEERLA